VPPIQDNGLRRVYCQIPLPFWMMIGKVFCLTSSVCDHLFGEQIVRLHTLIIEKKHPWKSTISHPKKSHHIGKTYGKKYMCPRRLNHFVWVWMSFKTKNRPTKKIGDPTKKTKKLRMAARASRQDFSWSFALQGIDARVDKRSEKLHGYVVTHMT